MNWKKTALICLLILGLAAGAVTVIFSTEPTAQQEGATKETAMLVDVTSVYRDTFQPSLQVTGTVQPAQDIILRPRIQGVVTRRGAGFVPGSTVRKGELLVQIDPADYQNALRMRESELGQAKANLDIEMGRQAVAQQDYELVDKKLPDEKKALALRKPQLESVQEQVAAAQAAVDQARLQLQRTSIRAPFNAQVMTRDVNLGSQVAPGDQLARLVGFDTYWIEASVPMKHLQWLSFPDGEQQQGAPVIIRNRSAWPDTAYREGDLYKLMGMIDDQTRLARVLIRVYDPLGRKGASTYPLMIGAFVQTQIQTQPIPNVVRVNRDFLRQGNTVWVMQEKELSIREIDILFRDAKYAYVSNGLQDGDQVITSNLATVVDGAPLRLESTQRSNSEPADSSITKK